MTIEEAISELAHYIRSDCLIEAPSNDACRMAIKALKEKSQREQKCEYCDFSSGSCGAIFDGEDDFFLITPDNSHEFYIATDGKGVFRETKIHFCPMCGRKLHGGNHGLGT